MGTTETVEEAIEGLQQLGLKEYQARCFVGLVRIGTGTAKQLSETTEVPRTRVYDAIRTLQARGLAEIQHSNPQRFRAVPPEEAVETLRSQYEDRIERVHEALDSIETDEPDDETPVQQVWAISERNAIETRTNQLIGNATDEVVLVIGEESLWTTELIDTVNDVTSDIEVLVGAVTEPLQGKIQTAVPDATAFISGLEWLHGRDDGTAIGRLLLVDRSTILVSSITTEARREQAIFGEGFGNGLVVIARQFMAQGPSVSRESGAVK